MSGCEFEKRVSSSFPTVPPSEFGPKIFSGCCLSIVFWYQKFLSMCNYFESGFSLVVSPLLPIQAQLLKFASKVFTAVPFLSTMLRTTQRENGGPSIKRTRSVELTVFTCFSSQLLADFISRPHFRAGLSHICAYQSKT